MSKTEIITEPGRQEIIIRRVLNAPRDLVFKSYTDPKSIPEWWGPIGLATTVDQMDPRKGGVWRFIQQDSNGNTFPFGGVYHESLFPERVVFTFEFEAMPGNVLLETVTFEELPDGKTRITDHSVFQTQEARDGMLQYGAAEGSVQLLDRFETYIEKLQGKQTEESL